MRIFAWIMVFLIIMINALSYGSVITKPNNYVPSNPPYGSGSNLKIDQNFNTIYNDYNGHISNSNIATNANILESKLNLNYPTHEQNTDTGTTQTTFVVGSQDPGAITTTIGDSSTNQTFDYNIFLSGKVIWDAHVANRSNPHEVTATQIGADNMINEININGTVSLAPPGMAADRLVYTDSGNSLQSLQTLSSFVTGDESQVSVTDDGSGGIILATPQDIATTSEVTFKKITADSADVGSYIFNDLTQNRLVTSTADNSLASVTDLTNFIGGTDNQVVVADAGSGSVTLSLPQDIDTAADVVFSTVTADLTGDVTGNVTGNVTGDVTGNVNFTDLTASRLLATDGSKDTVSTDLNSWVAGTSNQITVTDNADGTVTVSTPQDIDTAADVNFGSVTTTGDITADTSTFKVDSATNRVGVGTATPGFGFHSVNAIAGGTAAAYFESTGATGKRPMLISGYGSDTGTIINNLSPALWQKTATTNNYSGYSFMNALGYFTAFAGVKYTNHTSVAAGDYVILTATGGTLTPQVTITEEGYTGLGGDTDPDFELDVSGDARIQGANALYLGGTGAADQTATVYADNSLSISTTVGTVTTIGSDSISIRYNGNTTNNGNLIATLYGYDGVGGDGDESSGFRSNNGTMEYKDRWNNWNSVASGTGANAALSNLSSTAINTSLVSDADNTDDLGTDAAEWKDLHVHSIKHNDAVDPDLAVTIGGNNGSIDLTPHGSGQIKIESGAGFLNTNHINVATDFASTSSLHAVNINGASDFSGTAWTGSIDLTEVGAISSTTSPIGATVFADFDGTNDCAYFDTDTFDSTNESFTYCGWYRFDATGTDEYLAAKYNGTSANKSWRFYKSSNDQIRFQVFYDDADGNYQTIVYNADDVLDGNYHHMCAVYDVANTSIAIFINGNPRSYLVNSSLSARNNNAGTDVSVGCYDDTALGDPIDAGITDIFYKRSAFSPNEIMQIAIGESRKIAAVDGNGIYRIMFDDFKGNGIIPLTASVTPGTSYANITGQVAWIPADGFYKITAEGSVSAYDDNGTANNMYLRLASDGAEIPHTPRNLNLNGDANGEYIYVPYSISYSMWFAKDTVVSLQGYQQSGNTGRVYYDNGNSEPYIKWEKLD